MKLVEMALALVINLFDCSYREGSVKLVEMALALVIY